MKNLINTRDLVTTALDLERAISDGKSDDYIIECLTFIKDMANIMLDEYPVTTNEGEIKYDV